MRCEQTALSTRIPAQGVAPDFNFQAFTRALHGWWLVPFTNGGLALGLVPVPFFRRRCWASLVTGLVVYKRF